MSNKIRRKGDVVAIVVMAVLSVLLIPILAVNLTLIIKGNVNTDTPPDIFGVAPLAVTSGSMSGENEDSFDTGALIFVKLLSEEEKQSLQEGDVVCFRLDDIFVTHRIVSLNKSGEEIVTAVTRGDANNVTDGAIPVENIVGICLGSVAGLGNFTMFLQTPAGILVFVGIPVLLFIIYDVIRITLYNRRLKETEGAAEKEKLRDKDEEIRRLRALLEKKETEETSSGEDEISSLERDDPS